MRVAGESNGFKIMLEVDETSSGLSMPPEYASKMPMNLEYLIGVMITSARRHYGVDSGFKVVVVGWKKESREQDVAEAIDQCIRSVANAAIPSR